MTQTFDHARWQFWIDVGGTFTDCLARDDDGNRFRTKVLNSAQSGMLPPIVAMRELSGTAADEPLPAADVFLGTTRGTNALLTRGGAKTAFVTTKGIKDLILIGDQARPHLFKLSVIKPQPLYESAIEIDERILADGTVERKPNRDEIREQLIALRNAGIESLAVCLMHGYKYPEHEKIVGSIASELGFEHCRLSSEVAPLIKILPRAETTVLDAYLNPVLANYLDEIESQLAPGSKLRLMTSDGGLVSRNRFSGKDSVISGPAGGVVGAASVAQQMGLSKVIGFDMGGTSTDVSRFDGEFEREYEATKAGVRIVTPMLAIQTVAAGGGSVCGFDGVRLTVGPESAGANPGPACYGNGGPLAVTDLNLFLGRIAEDHFPFPLDKAAVEQRLEEIAHQVEDSTNKRMSKIELAEGFLKIANNKMALAIRDVSVAKGYDPRDYTMVSFGGAGSQHSLAVAEVLGIKSVLDHPDSSILSAVGIGLADQTSSAAVAVLEEYSENRLQTLEPEFKKLETTVRRQLEEDGCAAQQIKVTRALDLRYKGTADSQTIEWPDDRDFLKGFNAQHQRQFGYTQDSKLEIVAARVTANSLAEALELLTAPDETREVTSDASQAMVFSGEKVEAQKFDRTKLLEGDQIQGPAIIADRISTVIVDPGWQATVWTGNRLLIESHVLPLNDESSQFQESEPSDPVTLEIFNNFFSSIAQQMGVALQKTSISVNVKERLDFSCAIFTRTGDLVVNAPHIPVHLGAMSETVRNLIQANTNINAGDVFVTNDPYAGGSHLPDVTVATPVFDSASGELVFWLASRSHHAEIGGMAPGSMPAHATNLAQEGVLIQNFKIVDAGRSQFEQLERILSSGDYPSRMPQENLADIRAQIAANKVGETVLLKLVEDHSLPFVLQQMEHVQDAAERKARLSLKALSDGEYRFSDQLDNGNTINVAIKKIGDELNISFEGTSPVSKDNLNANCAIVSSAVMYVVRCLIDEDIPLNEGIMKPINIDLPECFLNPTPGQTAAESPAIVGGNVETSQRVVDVLLGALGLAAASQGTMNNWLIGDDSFGYYETIGGGSGATEHSDGADAHHCHMSNTRLTDPEILETRYPLVLREFAVRKNSGGAGATQGGNGMIREFEFTKPLIVSLLTSRRNSQPFGLSGGEPGLSGLNQWIRADGSVQNAKSTCELQVLSKDRLRLETPGGGGFGKF